MFKSNEQGHKRAAQHYLRTAHVDFTRSGWRQYMKLNRSLGARFIRGFILRHELGLYLAAHEAAGMELDEGCQEVRYEDGVYLLLKKMQGVWYITDVFAAEEAVAYEPVFFGRSCSSLSGAVLLACAGAVSLCCDCCGFAFRPQTLHTLPPRIGTGTRCISQCS